MVEPRIQEAFDRHASLLQSSRALQPELLAVAEIWTQCLRSKRAIITCGNGGSSADAQHIAAELVGRFLRERAPWPAIDLTSNAPLLTSISNDYGYVEVFSRQVRAFLDTAGCLVAISTSGNSPNVLHAAEVAREGGLKVVGLTGETGGRLAELCDVCLKVPSGETPRIQEMHLLFFHILCQLVEDNLADSNP